MFVQTLKKNPSTRSWDIKRPDFRTDICLTVRQPENTMYFHRQNDIKTQQTVIPIAFYPFTTSTNGDKLYMLLNVVQAQRFRLSSHLFDRRSWTSVPNGEKGLLPNILYVIYCITWYVMSFYAFYTDFWFESMLALTPCRPLPSRMTESNLSLLSISGSIPSTQFSWVSGTFEKEKEKQSQTTLTHTIPTEFLTEFLTEWKCSFSCVFYFVVFYWIFFEQNKKTHKHGKKCWIAK